MHEHRPFVGPVVLIADSGSVLADRIADELAERQFGINRVTLFDRVPDEAAAAAVLVERASSIEALRAALNRSLAPTLVLVATRELVVEVLPMLQARHDLAQATEAVEVLVWRLQRLIDWSRRLSSAQLQIDPLTGLLNRRAFETHLQHVAETTESGTTVGLLYLDLDRFKTINDSFGHAAGDNFLQAVGELMSRTLAPGDLIARLGGDEFGCMLARQDLDSLILDVERLLKEIAGLNVPSGSAETSVMSLTASAGLTFVRRGTTTQSLMSEADVAAYEAKNAGRGRLVLYGQPADAAHRSNAELRLRHFESATRLASERLVEMIALKSRRLVEAAKQEANVCSLTGLNNRRYFDVELPREIDRARSRRQSLSLAFIDLDHFHMVNMTYGWPTGDRVLQAFANVTRANVRSTDWIARYGGEEFVIVMPDTSLGTARDVVERVREAFASTTIESVDGRRFTVTLSSGVTQAPEGVESATAIVQRASNGLLWAKAAGRNQVRSAAVDRVLPVASSEAQEPGMESVAENAVNGADEVVGRAARPVEGRDP
jgi:diguanylate cyclase (GGDEF)-like protein